ncbi:MAG: hypothetical protein EBR82_29625 [Caulobacteraceae bacterium]|nr:hypothetical protein [Caulobacteraceae bacterium]
MDVVTRISRWLEEEDADDAGKTLRDAREEIISLRAKVADSTESLMKAIKIISETSRRAGYCEGTLMMIRIGHPCPESAAAAALKEIGRD